MFQLPGYGKRRVTASVRRRAMPVDTNYLYRIPRVEVELFAPDPRIYDNTEGSTTWGLASGGSGMTFNATFNLSFGGSATAATSSITNSGTFPTRPTLTITGPVASPKVTLDNTGEYLEFNGTLSSGEQLIVDLEARTVLLGGTASRYSWLTSSSTWWELAPGSNTVRFTAASYDTGTLNVAWRSAWL